jgi:hypothetical protein
MPDSKDALIAQLVKDFVDLQLLFEDQHNHQGGGSRSVPAPKPLSLSGDKKANLLAFRHAWTNYLITSGLGHTKKKVIKSQIYKYSSVAKADVSNITAIVKMPTPTDVLALQRVHKPLENIFTKPVAKVPKHIGSSFFRHSFTEKSLFLFFS